MSDENVKRVVSGVYGVLRGGWSNTKGCWQTYNAGTTESFDGDGLDKSLAYDEWHTLQLVVLDYAIFSYIDGQFCQAWWN